MHIRGELVFQPLHSRRERFAAGEPESRLPDAERLLSAVLSSLHGTAYRCRPGHRVIDFVTDGFEALTGYPPAEFLGNSDRTIDRLIHPDDRVEARRLLQAALDRRTPYELEYRIVRANGEIRWVSERGAGVPGADGEYAALEGLVRDISGRRVAEESLRETERRYRSIFENAIEGIFQSTPSDGYITANPALARMYGYDSPEDLIGGLRDIETQLYVQPGRRAQFIEALERDGSVAGFESQVYRRDGTIIWISENAREVRDAAGHLMVFEGTVEAISERKRHEALIHHQATHDALTGLPNRLLLSETLTRVLAHLPEGGLAALAFIDLDQFKLINDTLGHESGDRLLKLMAKRLQSCLAPGDMVTRHGGDEFVILFSSQPTLSGVRKATQRALAAVAQPFELNGRELSVTCSAGISVAPADGRDIETLLRCADAAMYRAKDDGRNTLRLFDPAINAQAVIRLDLLARLRRALERNEFHLAYQPICDTATRRLVGAEALIRWHTPSGPVQPGEFIGLAEETGLIVPIGDWVLRTACAQNAAWRKAGLQPIPISVNLSSRQLTQADLPERVAAILRDTGLPPEGLELEVTEGVLIRDSEPAIAQLHRLRALGISVSMDDFGTGYSSLSYLCRMPVQCLKIDRSFLRDVTTDTDSASIVRAVVSLGRELGLRTLAEGVETQAQLDFLRGIGCRDFQGFLLSQARPAQEFEMFLRAMKA